MLKTQIRVLPHILIKLTCNKNDTILFNANEWKDFLSYQAITINYLYLNGITDLIYAENFTLNLDPMSSSRVLKITKYDSCTFLVYERIFKLKVCLTLDLMIVFLMNLKNII